MERVADIAQGFAVAAFYKFVTIADPAELQRTLGAFCAEHAIKGTIIVAIEGINATVAGADTSIAALVDKLRSDVRFADLMVKHSRAADLPFQRLKVKVKPEIVTFGVSDASPEVRTGISVAPEDWNALISGPDVVVIDTRNDYEVEIGTFEGACNPKTRTFRDFPEFVSRTLGVDRKRKIAMFCTGGIRCEKASSYLLAEGFTDVYQLRGGILNYLEQIPSDQSLWRGECFVFDERVALTEGVRQGDHALCCKCGRPVLRRGAAACCCRARDAATPLQLDRDVV